MQGRNTLQRRKVGRIMGWANYQLYVSGIGLVSATARFDEIIGAYLSSVQSYPDRTISVYEMENCRIVLSFPVNVER